MRQKNETIQFETFTKVENHRLDANEQDIDSLAESIATNGLLTRVICSASGVLYCGHRRKGALAKIKEEQPERFEELFPGSMIPCSVVSDATPEELATLRVDQANNKPFKFGFSSHLLVFLWF